MSDSILFECHCTLCVSFMVILSTETVLMVFSVYLYLVSQEIDDLLERGDGTRIFFTPALEPWELDAYCKDENPALEVGAACVKNIAVLS